MKAMVVEALILQGSSVSPSCALGARVQSTPSPPFLEINEWQDNRSMSLTAISQVGNAKSLGYTKLAGVLYFRSALRLLRCAFWHGRWVFLRA